MASPNRRPLPSASASERAENGTETLRASATVPVCRVKKGKVKDVVVVITPMEDGLGGQKLVNTRKQSQKRNMKAAAWEKSSVAG